MTRMEREKTREELVRHAIVQRGQALYEERIRANVEPENKGKFLALDVDTGDYEIDADELAALDRLEARNPSAVKYLLRIGYRGGVPDRRFSAKLAPVISGSVTPERQAAARLLVRGPSGAESEIQAVIDTGFDGSLVLSTAVVRTLGLRMRAPVQAVLADGTETEMDSDDALVVWDGRPHRVAALVAESGCLIGMSLLYGYRLTVDVVDGGPMTIERLP